jgi:hypothetical protein
MTVSDAWFHRVKAAQRDLIKLCGGIERSAELTSISKSQIGRMNNPADGELMTLAAVVILEADCGQPVVTAVMAETNGRRLTDPEAERAAEVGVLSAHADLMRQNGELAYSMSVAIADGRVTPAEAQTIDRVAAKVAEANSELRAALAGIKAQGGVAAGLRLVGEGA